jgi:basic membrane protein A and related proteins
MTRILTVVCTILFSGVCASAVEFKPAVIFDVGGKDDKSFNQGVYQGAERFRQETGTGYEAIQLSEESEGASALVTLADEGYSPIIAVGYSHAEAMEEVASKHPDLQFAIIDMVVDQPNVASIIFKEHEGSYVVGILAAMASKTNTIGFVGGMDIPLIHRFACGFVGGVKSVKPDAEVIQDYVGTTSDAWRSPSRGAEVAEGQIARGADVIFHAAGGSGVGALKAAADAGKLGIGVDSDQNGLFPNHVLTSMLKHVDVATYDTLKASMDGDFAPGLQNLGLAEDGVGWAVDEYNEALITVEMKAAADTAANAIVAGDIKVHDYISDSSCPY